jgi:hypothetical protein
MKKRLDRPPHASHHAWRPPPVSCDYLEESAYDEISPHRKLVLVRPVTTPLALV